MQTKENNQYHNHKKRNTKEHYYKTQQRRKINGHTNHSLGATPIHCELWFRGTQLRREMTLELAQQEEVTTPTNEFTNTRHQGH